MANAPAAQASVAKRVPAMASVSANTNSARRCAATVEIINSPSPGLRRESIERPLRLGEREIEFGLRRVGKANGSARTRGPMTGSACPPTNIELAMVGTALSRLCPPYGTLSSPRRFQRLRRVDVEESAVALDSHLRDRFAMLGDQMPCADVAFERHQLVEEAARPQDRIAAAAVGDGHHDQIAAVGREGFDQAVDQIG